MARDRVLAELAALGPAPADAGRPGGVDAAPGGQGSPDEPLSAEPASTGEQGSSGEQGPSGEQGRPGAAGPLGRWGIPGLDPGALRRLGQELLYRADPDAVEERERKRFERRHLSFGFTLDDTGTLSGACGDTLSLEIIQTAVHAFGPPGGTEDTRTAAQRRMDGLTAACQAALDAGAAGTRHGAAPHLSILVDEQTLAGAAGGQARETEGCDVDGASGTANGQAGNGRGTDGYSDRRWDRAGGQAGAANGPARTGPDARPDHASQPEACYRSRPGGTTAPLGPPPARTGFGAMLTARQVLALACHAELSIIRWSDGIPLDAGRRYRTETPAIRRALEARDQGCRAPGCSMPAAWCTAHHLKPWSQGGTTSLQNTALSCFVHHNYFIHLLGWTITGDPNGTLHFTHPQGWPTLDSPLPSAKPCASKPHPP